MYHVTYDAIVAVFYIIWRSRCIFVESATRKIKGACKADHKAILMTRQSEKEKKEQQKPKTKGKKI